jgi:hypothetical protein
MTVVSWAWVSRALPVNRSKGRVGGGECLHVLSLHTLKARADAEADALALVQGAIAGATNLSEMEENILATRPLHESIALGIVKPFDDAKLAICRYLLLNNHLLFIVLT